MLVHSSTALARSRAQHTASPPSVHPVGWHVESRSDPSLQTMSISTRCNFKTFNIAPTPPLPTPPRIYMHKLDICYTYIYICRFTPPTLLPRQGHATPGQRTAPGPTAAAGGPRGAGGPRSPTSSSQTTRARNPQDWAPAGTAPRPPPPLPETPAKGQRQQKKAKLTNSSFFKSTSHTNLVFFLCKPFP